MSTPTPEKNKTDWKDLAAGALRFTLYYRNIVILLLSAASTLLLFGPLNGDSLTAFRGAVFFALLLGALFLRRTGSIFANRERTQCTLMDGLTDETVRLFAVSIGVFLMAGLTVGFDALSLSFWLFWLLSATLIQAFFCCAEQKLRLPEQAREKVVILCAGEQGQILARKLTENRTRIKILGYFDDREGRIEPHTLKAPFLGPFNALASYVRARKVDKIIVALPGMAQERLAAVLEELEMLSVPAFIAPDIPVLNKTASLFGAHGALQLPQLTVRTISGWRGVLKRVEDVAVSLVALILFLPIFIILPILIKLESPGPVFYTQARYGFNGKIFQCLKFRSMRTEACEDAEREIVLTKRNDPRVTKIGKFMRRTSLDEIPQFLNVLRGDMSIVGPRPHPPGVRAGERIYEDVIKNFAQRYKVKPGITGLAQIKGARGNTFTEEDLRKRFEYDMAYIQNWSLWRDIVIIIRTAFLGFTGKNAF